MEKSENFLKKLLDYGPSPNTIFLVLNEIKSQGKTGELLQECLKAAERFPDDLRLKKLLAESYLEMGFLGLAETIIAEITVEIDSHAALYKIQSSMLARRKKTDEALVSLKKYMAHFPEDTEAMDLLDQIVTKKEKAISEPTMSEEIAAESPLQEPEIQADIPETEMEAVPEPLESILESEPEEKPILDLETDERPPEKDAEAESEGEVVDLATPTLAELYFNQGEVQEAVATYEKVVSNNPDDLKSAQRLNELKASMEDEPIPAPVEADPKKQKTENAIAILENWRSSIQKNING